MSREKKVIFWLIGLAVFLAVLNALIGVLLPFVAGLAIAYFLDPVADKLFIAAILLILVGIDRITGVALLPAVVILCREILVSGLREFLAEVRVGVPVNRLAKWKTTIQMVAIGFLVTAESGPDFGPLTTLEVGLYGLWAAALLTLVTGFDYLLAGLKHIHRAES